MIAANNPTLKSWVDVPAESGFPIQNLPFGIFKMPGRLPATGVAIGHDVLDLACLHDHGFFSNLAVPHGVFHREHLNDFLALGKKKAREVRERISQLLRHDNAELKSNASVRDLALIPAEMVQIMMPIKVSNYTDFYSSEEHATNVGSMFRDPANALLPNWKHLPVAYHGRASSIVVSGTPIVRPRGQTRQADSPSPVFGPTYRLDFELEMAFITCSATKLGVPVSVADATEHIFGMVLLNDWSARDIQQWEYVPLGPFLAKNFGTTISPWIVTLDALEPFRVAGPVQSPSVLPYLAEAGARNFNIALEVAIQPEHAAETVVCRSNFKYLYWSVDQQLAHHTVNGCNIDVGDVYGSGTISGPSPGSYGSMLELAWNGQRPLKLSNGTTRTFLEDGDTVVMRGFAEKDGVKIGFGDCRGTIHPALS